MPNKLEILIRSAGRLLADHQTARLFKVPEEMVSTPCDFFGYTNIGRAILLEAKMVNRPALPVGVAPGLTKFQWNELRNANRAGALSLISWCRGLTVATISFDMAEAFAAGRKSIPWHKIDSKYHRPLSERCKLELLDYWLPLDPVLP